MYDELVKRLREQVKCDKKLYPQGVPFETLLLDLAADAIEELQAQLMYSNDAAKAIAEKVPKWISVTERLPEEQETVLTWGEQGIILLNWRHDNKWCGCLGDVTHWMPLPEPPKEE